MKKIKVSLQWVKEQIKKLPYPILLRLYYLVFFLRDTTKSKYIMKKSKIPLLSSINLQEIKKNDTVFILGCGPSINNISCKKWNIIAKSDTIASNFWLIHKFIPKIYFYEVGDATAKKEYETFFKLLEKRSADYENVVKIVMDLYSHGASKSKIIFNSPKKWRKNLYTAYNIPSIARNEKELAENIDYLASKGHFNFSEHIKSLFKSTNTLSALIALSIKMGYKTIVLCGIDLKNIRYFFNDSKLYPKYSSIYGKCANSYPPLLYTEIGLVHGIMAIDSIIWKIKEQILDPNGIKIYVENRSSALWPRIPEAPEDFLF